MRGRIARGAAWIAATRGAVNLIGFASTLLLARLLLPEDFGLVAIATTVVAIATSVTELSLGSALVQHAAPERRHFDTVFTLNAIRAAAVASITTALAWPLATLFGDERLIALVAALSALSALVGLVNPKLVIFSRELVFRQEFLMGVLPKLAGLIAAAAVAYLYRSYWALVAGAAVTQLAALTLSYVLIAYRPRFGLSAARELIGFSGWLAASQLVSTLNYRFDTMMIGYFLGKTQLGYYSYGDNLANLVTREVTSPIANTLFPAFSRMPGDLDRLRQAYRRSQALLFAIALPVGCGFAMIAKPFVHLVLGPKWVAAIPVIEVVAAATGVASIAMTYWSVAAALGQTRMIFNRDLVSFIMRVPTFAVGMWAGGFTGALIARVAAGSFGLVLNMGLIRKLLGVGFGDQVAANLRPLIAVSAMAFAVWAWQANVPVEAGVVRATLDLLAQCALGGGVYLLTLWLIWSASGRPEGVEREASDVVQGLRRRVAA